MPPSTSASQVARASIAVTGLEHILGDGLTPSRMCAALQGFEGVLSGLASYRDSTAMLADDLE